jgi:hypothetical protein
MGNDDLKRNLKEAVVIYLNVLHCICQEGLRKTTKDLSRDSRSPDRNETETFQTRSRSVKQTTTTFGGIHSCLILFLQRHLTKQVIFTESQCSTVFHFAPLLVLFPCFLPSSFEEAAVYVIGASLNGQFWWAFMKRQFVLKVWTNQTADRK